MKSLHAIATVRCSLLLACAAAALEGGCAGGVYAETGQASAMPVGDESVVYVETAPVNIEAYPHYYYGDGYAYYVDGRWYRHGRQGWGYYRQEPPELERQRVSIQQVPVAPRERTYVQQAPEAPRERPSLQPAPVGPRPPGVVEPQRQRQDPRRAPRPEERKSEPRKDQGR